MKALKRRLKGIFSLGLFSAIGIAMTWSIALGNSTPDVEIPPGTPISDTLQVGANPPISSFEGFEVPLAESQIFSTSLSVRWLGEGYAIPLLERGTGQISDLVIATITAVDVDPLFQLTVTLISDGESPITGGGIIFGAAIFETGTPQDLTSTFASFFGVPLPTVLVTSDVEVPEPASLALFGSALAGLAFARRRRKARAAFRLFRKSFPGAGPTRPAPADNIAYPG